jgi:hypothetical protein
MVAEPKSLQIVHPAPVSAMNVEGLLIKAVESGASIDALERLMALRERLVAEQARTAFFSALAGFQAECPVIPKTGEVKERGGQQVRYRFAPLDKIVSTIRPHLERHGLSYTFNAVFDLENHHLIAVCEVHHALGHTEASEFRVPISKDNFMNGAQHFGSASSYARRYALCNALGLLTGDEDDDGQVSAAKSQPAANKAQRQPVQAEAEGGYVAPLDKDALMRERRAQGIAAMGLVSREGERFKVTLPKKKGVSPGAYFVWRDEAGVVLCECPEYVEATDVRFRCEHILAVKHAVLEKLVKDTQGVETAEPEPADSEGVERRKLMERVVALGIELGYDTRLQLLARSKAAEHTNEVIRKKDIPALEKLVEVRRKEESGLRTAIYKELNTLYKTAEAIDEYMALNESLHGGRVLEEMRLEQLKKVAEGLEIK